MQTSNELDCLNLSRLAPPPMNGAVMTFTIGYFDFKAMDGDRDGILLQDLRATTAERKVFW